MKGAWGPSEERLQVSAHPSQQMLDPFPEVGGSPCSKCSWAWALSPQGH